MNSASRGSSTPSSTSWVPHALATTGAGQALVRGEDHVGVRDRRGELGDLVGGQVGAVGDPDGAVLEGVHGELVRHRFGVDAAVQPGRGVVAADRRGLGVGHRVGGVVAGDRVGLDRVQGRAVRHVLPDGEPDDTGDEQHHGRHGGDQDDPGASFLGPLRLAHLVDLGPTGLAATLRPGRLAHAGAPHCGLGVRRRAPILTHAAAWFVSGSGRRVSFGADGLTPRTHPPAR